MTNPEIDVFRWTTSWAHGKNLKTWLAEKTDSTNQQAKDAESRFRPEFEKPSLFIARQQSHGRGRGSNVWLTPTGSSLLSSWSFRLKNVPQPIFSPLAGLALFTSLHRTWPQLPFSMKAPNDIYLGEKKLAGILIETIDQGSEKWTVIGVGLNAAGHPESIENSVDLKSYLQRGSSELSRKLDGELNEVSWRVFLESWFKELSQAVEAGQSERLSSTACQEIQQALNRFPHLPEPVLKVDESGQLHFGSRIVRWAEL